MERLSVLLVLAVCFSAASAVCVFSSDLVLMSDYLMLQDNLYCYDAPAEDIDLNYAELCSEGLSAARDDPLGTKCASGYTQVGYPQYNCDEETGVLGSEIFDDDNLTPYTACVDSTDDVCTNVDTANSVHQMVSDSFVTVTNIPVESTTNGSVSDSAVYYMMACDSGYGYEDGVDSAYAVCTDNSDNSYTFLSTSGDGTCYAKCADDSQVSIDNVDSVELNGDSLRYGASGDYQVTCSSGFAVEYSKTDDSYSFTCNGQVSDSANSGVLTCDDCPVCLSMCPANPSLSDFMETYDQVTAIDINTATASGQTATGTISCESGYDAEAGSEDYTFLCSSNVNDTSANSGTYVLSGDTPTCHPKCYIANLPTIADVTFIDLDSDDDYVAKGTVVSGSINCASGYELEYDTENEFDFVCGDSDDGTANSGYFECDGDCPVCQQTCTIPSDDDEFHYELVDTVNQPIDSNDEIPYGYNHIEIACQNDSLNLVGERFLDCIDGSIIYNGDAPYCADVNVCEVPTVTNGYTDTNGNIMVGESYTIYCNPSYYFDVKTAGEYGVVKAGTIDSGSFSEVQIECEGSDLASFECYYGCTPPDFSGGVTYPDMVEEGGAPYPAGQTVTFSCLDNGVIGEGDAEATCDGGEIGSPICENSATSLPIILSLALSLLLLFLH